MGGEVSASDWLDAVQVIVLSVSGVYFGLENRRLMKAHTTKLDDHETRLEVLEGPSVEVQGFASNRASRR